MPVVIIDNGLECDRRAVVLDRRLPLERRIRVPHGLRRRHQYRTRRSEPNQKEDGKYDAHWGAAKDVNI